jgi:hypothetical protein
MKKFAFLLVLIPFLFNYSYTPAKKIKAAGNSAKVNFSTATDDLRYNYIMPDTTTDSTAIPGDTTIKG